ncbi:MAG: MerR family transcriptional regulator [Vicinamibacterales bacterium]|nr:MerR family transcriptional regulator [Vicinamibacterales bacterium]
MLKIHGVPFLAHTRKVIVAAIEKGVPYEIVPVIPLWPPAGWTDVSPLGLLRPGVVDASTGYRYYTSAQLLRLNRILVLRDLGLSLEQIGGVIDQEQSADPSMRIWSRGR